MLRFSAVLIWSLASASFAAAKTKILLVPVVSLAGDVGESRAREVSTDLLEELRRLDDVEVVLGGENTIVPPADTRRGAQEEAFKAAMKDLAEGAKQAEKLRFPQAIRALKKGIDGVAENIELLDNFQRLIDSYVLLAVAYFRRSQESAGVLALEAAARLSPTLRLDPARYPPLFLSEFARAKERVLLRRGSVRVVSTPPGAQVLIDGKRVGETPLTVDDLPAGLHHLVARHASGTAGQRVEVREGARADVAVTLGESAPTLASLIERNRFDKEVQRGARLAAKNIGADFVLVSALQRGKNALFLGAFFGNVRSGKWAVLDPLTFDLELAAASVEAQGMVRGVKARLANFGADLGEEAQPFVSDKPTDRPVAPPIALSPAAGMVDPPEPPARVPVVAGRTEIGDGSAKRIVDLSDVPLEAPRVAYPGAVGTINATPVTSLHPAAVSRMPDLDAEAGSESSVFRKWWFWGAVGASAVVLAGGAYFLAVDDNAPSSGTLHVVW